MLGKLIKYDLKFILKTVSIYGIILLCCALLFNITGYDTNCRLVDDMTVCDEAPILLQIFHTIFWNAIFVVIIGLLLNGVIRVWARFKINCFSDEAYLTHTLPITKKTLWLSKFCSAILTILFMLIVSAISFVILSLSPNGQLLVADFGITTDRPFSYYIIYLLTIFTQLLFMTVCGMTGIIIANRNGSHRNFHALVWGFIVYTVGVFIMLGCLLLASNFSEAIHAMIFGAGTSATAQEFFTIDFMQNLLIGIGIIYIVMTTTLYFVDQALINKGVNID